MKTSRAVYRAYGVKSEIIAHGQRFGRALCHVLGERLAEGGEDAALRIEVSEGEREVDPPAGAQEEYERGPFRCWSRDGAVVLESRETGSRGCVDAEGLRGRIKLAPSSGNALADDIGMYNATLMEMLRRRGRFFVHAAGLRPRETDRGVLIVGPGGSGKSTLTAALAREGLLYLSDDGVVVCRGAERVEARGEVRDFGLDVTCAEWLEELANVTRSTPDAADSAKRRVSGEELFPGQFSPRCEPALLLFPRIVPGRSRAVPLLPRTALVVLMQHSFHNSVHAPTVRKQFATLAELVDQCSSYELESGSDLPAFSGELADLVRRGR